MVDPLHDFLAVLGGFLGALPGQRVFGTVSGAALLDNAFGDCGNERTIVNGGIGCPGDSVVITDSGDVYVNNTLLDEPYLTEKSYGNADIEYPYTVPQNSFFVLGDHRESSVDSRSSLVGCVEKEEIIGKIIFRVWPIKRIGSAD